MASKAASTLSTLLASSSITDHTEILALTQPPPQQHKSKSKNSTPTDAQTLHIHLVALLKLDRDEDALRLLEGKEGEELRERAGLEYAYALYKCGRLDEARRVAREAAEGEEGRGRGVRHVEAQAAYRSEDFIRAAELYAELWEGNDDASSSGNGDEESDLRIQTGATDAQLEWTRQGGRGVRRQGREDLEAFETAYNAACGAIARGELGKGEVLLRTAKGLCASLDELTEAEKRAEILPIQVQQLYVLGKLGKTAEVEKLAAEIAVDDIPDASTRQIAQNNIIAASISPSSNPYLSHRLLSTSPTLLRTDKLFSNQSSLIEQNILSLSLLASKQSDVKKSTFRSLSTDPSLTLDPYLNSLSVLNAAAHTDHPDLAKTALRETLPLLAHRPTDIGLALTIIQLHIQTSDPSAATSVLETLLDNISKTSTPNRDAVLNAPGLIALLVSLYTAQNRLTAATTALATAASYWLHRSQDPPPHDQKQQRGEDTTSLLRAAAFNLLTSPNNPAHKITALDLFTHLHKTNPNDKFAHWGYIAASTPSLLSPSPTSSKPPTPSTLASLSKPLPPLAQTLDPLALEAAGVPAYPPPPNPTTASSAEKKRKPVPDADAVKKRKRVRISKRPKEFTEGKVMDPERWLPLRERSNFRAKGKKGKKREQTQGGVEKGGEKKAEGVVAAPPAPVIGGVGGGGGGAGKGKGKKKGKK